MATYLSAGYIRSSVTLISKGFTIRDAAAGLVVLLLCGAVGSVLVVWKYLRRVQESRLPAPAKEFFTGRSNKALQPTSGAGARR
jgi:hypothetical protein